MNNNTYNDLAKLGVFDSENISEEEYNKCIQKDSNDSNIYISGYHDNIENENTRWFKKIDTKGLLLEDIVLQLEILQTKNIIFIKKILLFSVLLTIISIVVLLCFLNM